MKYKVSGIVAVEIEADDVRDAMTKASAAKKKRYCMGASRRN